MVHILFRLATARPQLLADHVAAYADLVTEELSTATALHKRQLTLQFVGLACFAITAALVGVALMLWASLPSDTLRAPWVLAIVPVVPAVVGSWAIALSKSVGTGNFFASLRAQLAIDTALLRKADKA